jgi:hypothetical protein
MYYVYGLIDPRTNQYFYIGKGKKGNNRHLDHLSERHGSGNQFKWNKICKIQSLGLEVLFEVIIDDILDEGVAYDEETKLIRLYGKLIDGTGILTNIIDDGRPPSWKGRTKTLQHRQNLSKAMKGKHHTPETIQKILETKRANGTLVAGMSGKNHSDETKEKLRQIKTGTKMSAESSLKKSAATKGKPWTEQRRLACATGKKTGPKGRTWPEARRAAYERTKNAKKAQIDDNSTDN